MSIDFWTTHWSTLLLAIYYLIVFAVCCIVIYNTKSPAKASAYLLLVTFLPVAGIFVYFSFGFNYRKREIYSKKIIRDDNLLHQVIRAINDNSIKILNENSAVFGNFDRVARMILKNENSLVSDNNKIDLLINGEQKFPRLKEDLQQAKHNIHLEYYIYEDDIIGNEIAAILIQKAAEGVNVRFVYDAFGSSGIKKLAGRLRANGVEVYPFYKIIFSLLANRVNNRNHRKIVVIDGRIGYVGGINISDKYSNERRLENDLYWRDMSIRIEGTGVYNLQYTFLSDWNFASGQSLQPEEAFFPAGLNRENFGDKIVQTVVSGADSKIPSIMLSMAQCIAISRKEVFLTSPYFIPDETILNAIKVASLSGVDVKVLVPGISDSRIVNAASSSYYKELLESGVEVYRYQKGFVHAKTMVCDSQLSMVGSANMDFRSFDLNFEANAIIYDPELSGVLREQFLKDLEDAEKIDPYQWRRRSKMEKFKERLVRLAAPLM